MKTVTISEKAYTELCAFLEDSIENRETALEFLVSRFGTDGAMVKKEIAEVNRLIELEAEFRAAGATE